MNGFAESRFRRHDDDIFGNAAKERALKVVLTNASTGGGALKEKL
jgi:hypothetical protein